MVRTTEEQYLHELIESFVAPLRNQIKELCKELTECAVSDCFYAFLYNCCIHKSSRETISFHYSKEGAENAMKEHKQKALDEFNELYANDNKFGFKFSAHEDWCVEPVKVLPWGCY